MRGGEFLSFDIHRAQARQNCLQRSYRSTNDTELRAIDHADLDTRRKERRDRIRGGSNGYHFPVWHRLHESCTYGNDAQALREGENTSHAGCNVFTDAVANEAGRLDSP